jgi:hypothetical protein
LDKRYQVFVSSTFTDLQVERQAVMQALLSLDHFPAGMELFPASDDDQWALIRGVIDDSDYYVLVIGGRYGSTGASGISYTEMEYDYSLTAKIPILTFIHKNPEVIPSGKTDQDDGLRKQLEAFKAKVSKSKVVKYWSNPDELQAQVILSISAETKRNPQVGWVRANKASNPEVVEAMRQEIGRLTQELSNVKTAAPESSAKYSQGEDEVELLASYTIRNGFVRYDHAFNFCWEDLLFEVGPLLLEEASETQMKERLSSEVSKYAGTDFPEDSDHIRLSDDSFDTIKIQLMALGLISKSQKKHAPSDHARYWSLTPFGENQLTKLRAILKSRSA